jgi:hypothetical protein
MSIYIVCIDVLHSCYVFKPIYIWGMVWLEDITEIMFID